MADLRSAAWLEQELHPEEDRHRRHQMADICEQDNVERVWRVLGNAVAELRIRLMKILHHEKDISSDNDLRCPAEWTFRFLFRLPVSTKVYIKEKIHEYLVAKVMADRTATIIPAAAGIWEQRAEETLSSLRGVAATVHPPLRRVRRPLWPL